MGTWRHELIWLAGAATLIALIGGAVLVRARMRAKASTWESYLRAFQVEDSWMSGAQVLVPDPNGCYIAVGNDGQSTASWMADGDCSAPVRVQVRRGPPGEGVRSDDRASIIDAVPAIGGGYLAIGRVLIGPLHVANVKRVTGLSRARGTW
jgi:hypothetical protein